MSRPPIRRFGAGENPKVKQKTVVMGRSGTVFEDHSNKKELYQLAKKHHEIMRAQNAEIDLTQKNIAQQRQEAQEVPLNGPMPMPNTPPIQRLPTLDEQYEFLRQQRKQTKELPVISDDEEYEQDETEDNEQVSITDIINNGEELPYGSKKPSKPRIKDPNADWMDEEAEHIINRLNIGHMPLEVQKHIVNSNRGSNNPTLAKDRPEIDNKQASSGPKKLSNTEFNPNEPVDPPKVSSAQLRKLIEKEVAEKVKEGKPLVDEAPKTAPRFHIKAVEVNDNDFEPITLVSGNVFYDFDHVFIRRFNITDSIPLSNAKETQNIIAFVNAVGATLRIPGGSVLDLSPSDFRNVLYWHSFNSVTKTPLIFPWVSKYGNRNIYRINERDLKYITPKLTKEQYQKDWRPLGLTCPTMRDLIFYLTEDLTGEELKLFTKAQWFIGDKNDASFQSKIDAMVEFNARNLDAINAIPEFSQLQEHGIEEYVDVVDAQFDPEKYLEVLKKQLDLLYIDRESIENNTELDEREKLLAVDPINDQIVELDNTITELAEKINRKERVEADAERMPIQLGLLDFFPNI